MKQDVLKQEAIELTDQEVMKIQDDFADVFVKTHNKYQKIYNVVSEMAQNGQMDGQEYMEWFNFITDLAFRKSQDKFYIRIPLKFRLKTRLN